MSGDGMLTPPPVQACVASEVAQPAGYDIEMPWILEVKLDVNGGGADETGLDDGDGDGDADGPALGGPPTFEVVRGLRALRPTTPMASTTMAAIAALAKVFMWKDLHGAGMSTRRCGVVSMASRTEARTQSGARLGASRS